MASIFSLFVPSIKDFTDIINILYGSIIDNNNLLQFLQSSFIYLLTSIKFLVFYFFSFQWIKDLSYLPIIVPQLKLDILKEHLFLQTPQSNFFTFLEIPNYTSNKFLLGFANSFFLCLPLSVAHFISIRRLLIQGLPAGFCSSLGTICGQTLLLICILFGGRFFITPWFNLQVFNYFFGLWLVLKTIYDICHERSIRLIDKNNIPKLTKIFLLNFVLSWTEQTCIFQYFGNLTLGAEPSIIEIFSALNVWQSIVTHVSYITGIIVGSVSFTSLFIIITLKLNTLCVRVLSILYSTWIRRLNYSLIIMIITVAFTSIPFYSFDYLILSNFGFGAQDKSFQNTIFSPTKTYDYSPALLGNMLNFYGDEKPGIDTDITPFNKGRYLMFDVNDSFEQLNYQGEYAWLTRKNRVPNITRQPSPIFPKISNFFKKNKKYNTYTQNIPDFQTEETTATNLDNNFGSYTRNNQTKKTLNLVDSRNITDKILSHPFENLIDNASLQNFVLTSDSDSYPILKKNFQDRYYSNPIYKLLLSADIDFFLSRQPKYMTLSPQQENDLYKKRVVLANYYDSLRYYNQLPYEEDFNEVFHGSKSYADRVYNHQFKGTLKIVRRLFRIDGKDLSNKNTSETFNEKNLATKIKNTSSAKSFVLKFDQLLFTKNKKIIENNDQNFDNQQIFNTLSHEELNNEKPNKSSLFIELVTSTPFYIGWDEQLRKLVITNRLSSVTLAGQSIKYNYKNWSPNSYFDLNQMIKKNKTIAFTSWPLQSNKLQKAQYLKKNSYNFLMSSLKNLDNLEFYNELVANFPDLYVIQHQNGILSDKDGKIESVPSNILAFDLTDFYLSDTMPSNTGGYIWPGHSKLNFNFKLLEKNKS